MLKQLKLRHVGPATPLNFDPVAPRLNVITGDNGLGKTFLLETSWRALTRTWHEMPAIPSAPDASIEYSFDGCSGLIDDWTRWQDSKDPRFSLLSRLLEHLGPDEQPMVPGTSIRPTLDDQRRIPTLKMPYGQEVPLTYAPADVYRWLISDVFDLEAATSAELEGALRRAKALLAQEEPPAVEEIRSADVELERLLPEMDPFFVRWRYYFGKHLDGDLCLPGHSHTPGSGPCDRRSPLPQVEQPGTGVWTRRSAR